MYSGGLGSNLGRGSDYSNLKFLGFLYVLPGKFRSVNSLVYDGFLPNPFNL